MAWRIHGSVVRGEVDNRQRNVVKGRIWLKGLPGPLELDLKGNAAPDLAGCLLTFENPREPVAIRADEGLNPVQTGTIGDLTASRKMRVLDMPVEEAFDRAKKKLPVPEHMANCLYLEWYSEANGRVVIESTDFKLTISPPCWRLTPEEEAQRSEQSSAGFLGFMQRLSDAVAAKKHDTPEDKEWDEFDYEKFMQECDARTEKYGELLDKYRDHPDRERIIAREMGWDKADQEQPEEADAEEDVAEEQIERDRQFNAPEPEPDPATKGIDWVRNAHGEIHHPLALRAFEGSCMFWHKLKELGFEDTEDDDLCALRDEYQITAVKLGGALGAVADGRAVPESAFTVAYLKRALGHLHTAQAALERVAAKKLLPHPVLQPVRAELFSLREDILRLMKRFREQR